MTMTEPTVALANQYADTQFRLQATILGEPARLIKTDSFQGNHSKQHCRIVKGFCYSLPGDNCRSLDKVGVLRPVQQPGSYWDRSSELPLVGLEPTEVTAYD